jgi:RNA polymerase primary sigma factor
MKRKPASKTASKRTASKRTASKRTASKRTASKRTASKRTASKRTAPKRTAPKRTAVKKRVTPQKKRTAKPVTSTARVTQATRKPGKRAATAAAPKKVKPPKVQPIEVQRDLPAGSDTTISRRLPEAESAIKLYLREIGKVALLTPQEEIKLAARIKRGDKKAREHMIKANLRLVVKIARDYEGIGLPLLDLISEGNIGLMKAVERFDPSKGGKLSTYGSWWIKQSIKRALANQSKTIRLPVHLVDKISKMRRAAMRLQEELGREPTDEELADELDLTPVRVRMMRRASIRPASLDAPIGDDDSNNFSEIVQDENATTPYEDLEEKTVTKMLREMIATLDPREETILRYRFGLDGGSERTLEEVGQKFGVTRERIRQIQNIALRKMRKMIEKLETTKS